METKEAKVIYSYRRWRVICCKAVRRGNIMLLAFMPPQCCCLFVFVCVYVCAWDVCVTCVCACVRGRINPLGVAVTLYSLSSAVRGSYRDRTAV